MRSCQKQLRGAKAGSLLIPECQVQAEASRLENELSFWVTWNRFYFRGVKIAPLLRDLRRMQRSRVRLRPLVLQLRRTKADKVAAARLAAMRPRSHLHHGARKPAYVI